MEKDDYQQWLDMVKEENLADAKKEEAFNEAKEKLKIQLKEPAEVKEEKKIDTKQELEPKKEPEIKAETGILTEDESKNTETTEKDSMLDLFYSEIDDIKSETFKTTSKEQLERLLRDGSTYFNLNPFEVLQIDPYCSKEEMKKKYRKLAIYVHPDKNPDDKERADIAFEAVNRAHKMLDDDKERKKCIEVVEEATERVNKTCEEKRKKLKREKIQALEKEKSSKHRHEREEPKPVDLTIDEDDPDKYRYAIYVMTCKLFADIERLKVRERERNQEEKKRKAEEKVEEDLKNKSKREWDNNYEKSRQGRVSSWQNFARKPTGEPTEKKAKASVPKSSKPALFFRPPKHKPESR